MSVSDEGDQFPAPVPGAAGSQVPAAVPGGSGQVYPPMLGEAAQRSAVMLAANQPAGAVFALGWMMAELFDPRRQVSATVRQSPFDPQSQLPLVTDLTMGSRAVYLAAGLAEYLQWFPQLAGPLGGVTAAANRNSPAVAAGGPVSAPELPAAVAVLHQAVLDEFANDPQRLSAYQLGLSLSDLVWLPSAARQPSALFGLFARQNLASVQTLLSGAGPQLPTGAATIVSRSLDNWADWIDVNSARMKSPDADQWSAEAGEVLRALRVQGWIWRSVLVADPEVSVQPGMGAWVEAGSSLARTTWKTGELILRRFWPLVVFGLVLLGGLLYLVISNLSGASQVWASLVTVGAVVGSGTWGLGSGISSALDGVGYELWSAAKLDAAAWNVTWLPALTATPAERFEMERRGVAMPQLRKNLDVPAPPPGRPAASRMPRPSRRGQGQS